MKYKIEYHTINKLQNGIVEILESNYYLEEKDSLKAKSSFASIFNEKNRNKKDTEHIITDIKEYKGKIPSKQDIKFQPIGLSKKS